MGSFFNYVDKVRQVGGTGNVNGMQIFPQNSKEIPPSDVNWGKVGGQKWTTFGQRSLRTTPNYNDEIHRANESSVHCNELSI